jgi:hypothetical protein
MPHRATCRSGSNRVAESFQLPVGDLGQSSPIGPRRAIRSIPVPTRPTPPREAARAAPGRARMVRPARRAPGPRATGPGGDRGGAAGSDGPGHRPADIIIPPPESRPADASPQGGRDEAQAPQKSLETCWRSGGRDLRMETSTDAAASVARKHAIPAIKPPAPPRVYTSPSLPCRAGQSEGSDRSGGSRRLERAQPVPGGFVGRTARDRR